MNDTGLVTPTTEVDEDADWQLYCKLRDAGVFAEDDVNRPSAGESFTPIITPNIPEPFATDEIPISLDYFIQTSGVSDTTIWRWRKQGMLKTENIAGRLYILPKNLREFRRRVEAGEFSKKHQTPIRVKTTP